MGVTAIMVLENDQNYYTATKNKGVYVKPVDGDERVCVWLNMPRGTAIVQLIETDEGVKAIANASHFKEPVEWNVPIDNRQVVNGSTGNVVGTSKKFMKFALDAMRVTSNGELFKIELAEDEQTQVVYKKYTK